MNLCQVISVLAALAAVGMAAPTPGCDEAGINAVITKCYADQGIAMEDVRKFLPQYGAVSISEEDFRKQCANQQQYLDAGTCTMNELKPCYPEGFSYTPDTQKAAQLIADMCNDAKLNYSCFVEVSLRATEMQNCFMSQLNFGKDIQEIICEGAKVSSQCTMDMIRKCDDYTASALVKYGAFDMPDGCDAYPTVE